VALPGEPERSSGPVFLRLSPRCPHCGSPDTWQLSRFGSTACKALWRCRTCAEPFDIVKPL
jgi:ring-1,2-phenylacetyl-CoA epoxidase subunit PaaD